ncbi:hypothetical protein [Microvirga sp. VF16]|uniref:hypothetical protein n=1 Tax=Microvirga sp. VF16 TaxID=2807101 RepID=UPI00193DFFC4|nr:hypothetical protein [Microvirga sp. VF16]QRM33177.1 hypothetical protein JO965_28260 [Microvirga sp. VF16]
MTEKNTQVDGRLTDRPRGRPAGKACTDLSEEEIERLRAGNILYGREGTVKFFQVDTRTRENGFFFELVERRGYRALVQ